MNPIPIRLAWFCVWLPIGLAAAPFEPAPQRFHQEMAERYGTAQGLPAGEIQLLDARGGHAPDAFAGGRWYRFEDGRWVETEGTGPVREDQFGVVDGEGRSVVVAVSWRKVRQVLRHADLLWWATDREPLAVRDGQVHELGWPEGRRVHQLAAAPDGTLWVASAAGLFERVGEGWRPVAALDTGGRDWAGQEVRGVVFDARGQLWFGAKAGVACRQPDGWRFYEGKDGLPWNDFAGLAAGADGSVWFATGLGAIRFEAGEWHYRQGPRWLPHDAVRQVAADGAGGAWLATAGGLGRIRRQAMTLAEKAAYYEDEIERYVKRTPFGYVAEAPLRIPGDRSTAQPEDSDNDGLWTAMYGAGECLAFAATGNAEARNRARQAFEALRFLQKVTQGGPHSPPKGFVARTIRSTEGADPNLGRLESDRRAQQRDSLWKIYEPRWPRSADGRWYWKSDTSSDELDGHFFFYPLYYDFCAGTDAEKERVREVVRDLADHLVTHDFVLVDHDGRPTRWGIFGPQFLNRDPNWWPERGLNSLSILTYLAVAAHVTGDPKYAAASRDLIDRHGYAQNAMYPKVQHGPGSGNQSDDEMAFMCYYTLLRCSADENLKAQMRYSFYRYWANEAPEMNPFFNFSYAAHNLTAHATNPWGRFPLAPWADWHGDAMTTLYGFPLDRLDWPHRNRHRLDLRWLEPQASVDLYEPDRGHRGFHANGKVLPIENRHFNHWNTDPWRLDYGGNGSVLGAGTVFLLPYYLGLYHGFIAKP